MGRDLELNARQISEPDGENKIVKYVPLILAGVLLSAFAQILLKKGMIDVGQFDFSVAHFQPTVFKVALNPYILIGLGGYVASVLVWLLVLSRVEVSFAYPFVSLGFIVTAVLGWLMFDEALSVQRMTGILVICVGVILVSKS
ncbi:MAG: EamA family transporter [Pseudomonadota bacterium]|nr:EamA family transporter [Burkholderiales bacterium]MDQ3195140.1 EamA family transporter [Pseudomonadota bacterium]